MEAEADRKRDALDRKIAAGYDPATNKWTTPKSPSRLPENRKSSFPEKKPSATNPLSNVPKLGNQNGGNGTGITNQYKATAVLDAHENAIKNDIFNGSAQNYKAPAYMPKPTPGSGGGYYGTGGNQTGTGFNNGGGMGGGQGGGSGGGGSSNVTFRTIDGKVIAFA